MLTWVKDLNLENNQITNIGAEKLMEALPSLPNLTVPWLVLCMVQANDLKSQSHESTFAFKLCGSEGFPRTGYFILVYDGKGLAHSNSCSRSGTCVV